MTGLSGCHFREKPRQDVFGARQGVFGTHLGSRLAGSVSGPWRAGVRQRGSQGSQTALDGSLQIALQPFQTLDFSPRGCNLHLGGFGQRGGFLASAREMSGRLLFRTQPHLACVRACHNHGVGQIACPALIVGFRSLGYPQLRAQPHDLVLRCLKRSLADEHACPRDVPSELAENSTVNRRASLCPECSLVTPCRQVGGTGATQGDECYLGRAIHPKRKVYRADAPADEDAGSILHGNASQHRELPASDGSEHRQHDLASMRVTREYGRDRKLDRLNQPPGIVREQDCGPG